LCRDGVRRSDEPNATAIRCDDNGQPLSVLPSGSVDEHPVSDLGAVNDRSVGQSDQNVVKPSRSLPREATNLARLPETTDHVTIGARACVVSERILPRFDEPRLERTVGEAREI